jgi:hypothetical protein
MWKTVTISIFKSAELYTCRELDERLLAPEIL